jgi:hypothetical protein
MSSLGAYLQVLLEANKEQFREVTAMINSPVIDQILEENGWAEKFRQQERQVWEQKWWKTEAERRKAEAENAELKEQLRLFQQAQAASGKHGQQHAV